MRELNINDMLAAGFDITKIRAFDAAIGEHVLHDCITGENSALYDAVDTGIPTQIGVANSGLPVELFINFSNTVIEARLAPEKATKIFNEIVIGDWTLNSDKYRLDEFVGSVAPYSDYGATATADVNSEWFKNDFYLFETVYGYGELEAAKSAVAKINLAEKKQRSAMVILKNFSNRSYFYGIQGKQIFGILNHPALNAAIPPISVGGVTNWDDKTALQKYDDIRALVQSVIDSSGGNLDESSAFKIAYATSLSTSFIQSNEYSVMLIDRLKKAFPNISFESVPEFNTDAGAYVYAIFSDPAGEAGELSTNCRLKEFPLIRDLSSAKQKAAAGTGGFRLYRPYAIGRMLIS